MKASSNAWLLVGKIPIGKFEGMKCQGLLTNRVFHASMDIITQPLKQCAQNSVDMVDPNGRIHHVKTILAAYLADYPEQLVISCVSAAVAPSSFATKISMGDAHKHLLRHGSHTLQGIQRLVNHVNPSNISQFKAAAKCMGLNGVTEPFWRDWEYADPCHFLAPDALHQWHKMFIDHAYAWARHWLGDEELDQRLSVLQPRVGCRHFTQGITRFKQHTGREQRDLERVFIGIIYGHPNVTKGILKAMRAYMDFIYLAQYESHDTHTLRYLDKALQKFHQNKQAISISGARDGPRRQGKFNIQKLELMQHVTHLICLLGSVDQFTADQTERCHITMAKIPYRATNKKEYSTQMCRFIDSEEKVNLFASWLKWVNNDFKNLEDESPITGALEPNGFSQYKGHSINGHRTTHNCSASIIKSLFASSDVPSTSTTAFHVTKWVTHKAMTIEEVTTIYKLPNLSQSFATFFTSGSYVWPTNFTEIDTWDHFRLPSYKQHDTNVVLPPQTVQALQPSLKMPYGRCNFVLVQKGSEGNFGDICGHFVAQVRLIFRPRIIMEPANIFLYIECLKPAPQSQARQKDGSRAFVPDDDIEMFHLVRAQNADGTHHGFIIQVQRIWHLVELIPSFGKKCPSDWNCDTSMELAKSFYLNCFSDKETYQSVF